MSDIAERLLAAVQALKRLEAENARLHNKVERMRDDVERLREALELAHMMLPAEPRTPDERHALDMIEKALSNGK